MILSIKGTTPTDTQHKGHYTMTLSIKDTLHNDSQHTQRNDTQHSDTQRDHIQRN